MAGASCGEMDTATGALPLAMTSRGRQQEPMIGTDVNVAHVSLNTSMRPALQKFCDSTANPAEKARALELLTALELSDTIKAEGLDGKPRRALITPESATARDVCDEYGRRRPKTAAPRLECGAIPGFYQQTDGGGSGGGFGYANSYETTHNYFFQAPVPSPTVAVRPASSQMQRVVPPPRELAPGNSFADLFMTTTYGREFFAKSEAARRPALERAASSRGVRNNNPHPNKEFLVWRYRRPMTATDKIEAATSAGQSSSLEAPPVQEQRQQPLLTNESFDRAVRGKYRSVYKHDYLGVPNSFDVSQLVDEGPTTVQPPYDRSPMSRSAYSEPAKMPPELTVSKARFGQKPALASPGVLPSGGLQSRQAFGTRTRTTYEAHVCDPARRLMRVEDLRQLSNEQNAQVVSSILEGATGGERAALLKLYREMQCRQLPSSIPSPLMPPRRIFKERVGGPPRLGSQPHPSWVSTWSGPGA